MKRRFWGRQFIMELIGCVVWMLLVSCGGNLTENQTNQIDETEMQMEGTSVSELQEDADGEMESERISDDICQKIQQYDFTVQEYPIDTTLYTAAVEEDFLKSFYEVLTNQVPLWYFNGQAIFFRDELRGASNLSDREFVDFVKNAAFRLIDMDGDGFPELAMEWNWELSVFKYDMEEMRVSNYFGPREGWKLLGSNRFGLRDAGSAGLDRSDYFVWDEQCEIMQSFHFEIGYGVDETEYTVSGSGEIGGRAVVSEEEWNEVTEKFRYAMANPIEFMTYEEVFGDVAHHTAERNDVEEAQQAYQEFLAGERSVAGSAIGTGDVTIDTILDTSDSNGGLGEAEYLIYDLVGDNMPELLIRTKKKYDVLTYRNGLLRVLFEGSTNAYEVLDGGKVLYRRKVMYRGSHNDYELYECYQIQMSGGIYIEARFWRTDLNGDGVYDEKDQYEYNDSSPYDSDYDTKKMITMEEWLQRIAEYLYVNENGMIQAVGSLENLEWTTYFGEQ